MLDLYELICSAPRSELSHFAIKKCTETMFLGVIIDEQLNWDAYIEHLNCKLIKCNCNTK